MTKIPKDIFKEYVPTEPKAEDLVTAPEDILFHSFYEGEDGKLYQKLEGGGRLVKEETPLEKTHGTKIRHFIGIVKARRTLLQGQLGESTDKQIKNFQYILNDRYDTFLKKFGYLNARGNIDSFIDDPSYHDIATLEEWDEETQKGTKADIFSQRVVPRYVSPTKADTAQDALTYSLAEKGYVDLEYMSNLSGLPHQVILDQLSEALFEDPETGGFVTSEEYLSGNVVQKLRTAESLAAQDKRYVKNREALKEVQPKLLAPSDMDVSLGAPWVGGENYEQFVKELFSDEFRNIELQIKYNLVTGGWVHKPVRSMGRVSAAEATRRFKDASESRKATHDYGTSRMNFFQLLEKIMNSNRIFVTDPDPDHKGQRILNERETTLANQMAARINDKFRKWALFEDRERSDTLRQRYNQKINSYVLPEYDGDFLQFPGKNPNYPPVTTKRPDGLYKTQKNAVWRWITQGNTYLAHDMGTGKTITGALIAMEAKRLKLKKKPMIVTLKNVVQQYAAEFKRVYPSAKILVFDLKGGADKIRETLGKVVNNNWDAIIVSQPTFERIKMTPETNAYYLNQDLAEYYAYLQEIRAEEGTDARSVRQRDIVEAIQKLEAQIKRELAVNEEEKAKNIYFEELGVDLMIVDEAHAYKNVPYVTKRGNVKGVDPNRSATGRQVYYKTRWMNDTMLSPAGKPNGIVFMSGTMLSNSVGELFSIQRYLQPRALKEANLQHFDRWADTFGEIRQEAEPKLTGDGFQIVTKFANFVNVSDLKRMAYQNIDVVKSDDVGLTRPAIEGGEPHRVIIQQSPYVEQYQAIIRSRAETIKADARHAEYRGIQDNMLRLVSDGSKVAIDQRLISDYADTEMQEDSKINKAAENIVKYYQETKDRKGTQLVFCDLGVPRGAYGKTKELTQEEFDDLTPEEQHNYAVARMGESATKFNVFDGLKAELVKRGIPGNEIAFIHDAEASSQKLKDRKLNALFKAFNSGKIRVLIGTTQKLGTGTNVQKKVVAIHHMDIWWNYAALGQRNARGWRAGNENKEVAIFEYATKATVDSFRWDKVATKGRVIDGFMSKNMTIRRVSDISEDTINARTMAAIASSDPRRLELTVLENRFRTLEFQRLGFQDDQRRADDKVRDNERMIDRRNIDIEHLLSDMTLYEGVDSVKFGNEDRIYLFKKDGKEISEKLEALRKDKNTAIRLKTESSKESGIIIGNLGVSAEREEIDNDGKKNKVIDFNPRAITIRFRPATQWEFMKTN
ncbi:MAG: DEAD/DEAH box helicase family protein, partial [Pseudomonadota bacterium]